MITYVHSAFLLTGCSYSSFTCSSRSWKIPRTILGNDHAISRNCAIKEALALSFTAVETRSQLSVLVYFELGFE